MITHFSWIYKKAKNTR